MSNLQPSSSSRNITMFVTCIRSEGKFLKFFALSEYGMSDIKKFENLFLEKACELEADEQLHRSHQLPPNSLCCVKSAIKRSWCRARVQYPDFGVYRIGVMLIDYGDKEILPMVAVRKCVDPVLQSQPALVKECILADVGPPFGVEWPPEAIKLCEEHLLFQKVSGYVVTEFEGLLVVRVAKIGENEPFVQRLINNSLAKIEPLECAAKPEPTYFGPGYKFMPLDIGTSHMVTICFITNPQNFYIQLSPAEVELSNLMEAIEQWSTLEKMEFLNSPLINTPCLVQLNTNGLHYFRGIIKDVSPECCKVFLVDYGNIVTQKFQQLRVLPKHFLALPAQAIRCALFDANQLDVDMLKKICGVHRYLTCQVLAYSREGYHVRLLHHDEDILTLSKKLERSIPSLLDFSTETLPIGSLIEVNTSYIYSPHEFYCQKTAYRNQLDSVTNMLANVDRFNLLEHTALVPGSSVIAKFSEDGMWYRAKILKAEDIYNITVFFVDYGNTDKVKLQDLRTANQELFHIPSLAFRFALYDLPSSEGPLLDDAFNALENLTDDKTLKADIKCTVTDGSYSVILFDIECPQVSVNEKLEGILNPPRCVYPPVNKVEVICIMYYTSPSLFFGQLTKYDSVVLTNLQADMNAFYGALRTKSNSKPKVGDLVSAKFTEDDTFYRARVVSHDNNTCKVFFVDYGNTDNVNMEDIHELHSKFCTHPIFGIECILENCPASAPIDDLEGLMLDKEIQVALVKEISPGKWLVSLTENYAGNAEILACFEECSKPSKQTISQPDFAMNRINSGPPNKSFGSASSEVRSHSPKPFPPADNMKCNSPSPPPAKETPKPSQLLDYDSPVIPDGCFREIYVCLVKNPSEFYCQLISDDKKLQSMMSKITNTYNNLRGDELKLDNIRVGMTCCAIYEEDGMWYRAKITNYKPGSNSSEVLFVDYGNSETVPLSKIKALHPDFFDLAQQAFQCGLFNVTADGGTWSARAIEAFSEIASDKSFLAQFVKLDSKKTHLITLLNIQKLTSDVLNEEFIKLGHGHMSESNKLLVVNSFTASTSFEFQEPDLDFNKRMDVTIVWATKFMNFYCQLKSYAMQFQKMMVDIQSHYGKEAAASGVIDRPHAGMICIAQFSKDSAWYRAKILEVEKQAVKVHYVDYGNSENISKKCVKYISQDYTLLPTQAIRCCLHGIQPSKNGVQESITHLLEGDSTCTFVSKEKDYYFVTLECNRKNIAQELVRMNLAVSNEPTASLKQSTVVSAQPFKEPTTKPSIPKSLTVFEKGQLINVVVSYVTNPREFWCQLDDGVAQLDILMEAIESHYATSAADYESYLEVGSSCIAKYSGDEGWYRAVVKSCPNDNQVEVMFVDYGNSEAVEYSQVRTIHSEFLQLPAQALKCQLYGLPPSYDDDSKLKFKEITEMSTELMAKVENVQNDILTVTLFDSSNPDNEVNVLEAAFGVPAGVEKTEESSHIGFLPPNVPDGTHQGYVSSAQTPLEFYIQLSSQEAELEKFSEDLQDIYSAETDVPPILENVTVGASCCALFSEDEAWYRAIITNILDDAVTVVFIDYGNFDTVPGTSLRELHQNILETPPFAIPCQLAMVSSGIEEWSSTAKETFLELTDDVLLEFKFLNKDVPALIHMMREEKNMSDLLIEMGLAFKLNIEDGQTDVSPSIVTDTYQSAADTNQSAAGTNQRVLASKIFKAKMAFVDSHEKFFITAVDWCDERDTIMEEVKETYADSDNALFVESVQLNGLCVAKYSEDEAWYRAIITEIDGSNVLVKFIDYGNSETTCTDSLKQLTPNLLTCPACAVECHLSDLHPVPGHESEITALLQSLADEETEFEVTVSNAQETYSIHIETVDGDFVNLLISKDVAASPKVEKVVDNIDVKIPASGNEEVSTDIKEIYPERVITSSKLQVKICFVHSWDKFYVMPTDWSEDLDSLMAKIEEQYSDDKDTSELVPQNIQEHQPCIAKYSEDGAWYRAVITSVHDDNNIFINFVDYGNAEINELQNLRTVTSDLLIAPPFAIECKLLEISLAEGAAPEVTARLQTFCDEEVILEMEIFDHSFPCKVRIRSDVDFVEQLLQDDLVLKDLPSDRIQNPEAFKENLQIAFVDDSLEDMKRFRIPTRPLPSGSITAFVKHCHISVNGYVSLYVVEEHLEDALAEQQENLQITYSDVSKSDLTINEGDYCIAMFPEDSCWYRAVVLERHSDKVIVRFVDFGNSEVITIDSIKELVPEFAEQANFCTECVLSCVKAVEGSEEAVEERFLDIEGKYQLDLCGFNFKNDIVCVKGIALNDINIIPQMVEETLVKQVLPSHYSFDSFECKIDKQQIEENLIFHLSPLCLEEKYQELKELLSVYNGFVLSESPKICLDDLYVVKKDSEYFRAYINNFEDSIAHVTYVDTGNTCSVPLSDIRLLYQDFYHIPPFSLQCCLQGVNNGEDQEVTSQKLFDFLEGKVVTCTFTGVIRLRNYHEVQMTVDGENILAKLLSVDAADYSMVDEQELKSTTDVSIMPLTVPFDDIVPDDDKYVQEENIESTLDEPFNISAVTVIENIGETDLDNTSPNEINEKIVTDAESKDAFVDESAEKYTECSDLCEEETVVTQLIVTLDLEKCEGKIFDDSSMDESVVAPNDDLEKCEDERTNHQVVDMVIDDLEKCEDERTNHQVVDMMIDDLGAAETTDEDMDRLLSEVQEDAATTSFNEKPECETDAVANVETAAEDEVQNVEVEVPHQPDNIDLCEADLPECEQSCTESYQLEECEIDRLDDTTTQPTEEKTDDQSIDLDEERSPTIEASAVTGDGEMHSPVKSESQADQEQLTCGVEDSLDIDGILITEIVESPNSLEDSHFEKNSALNANLDGEVDFQSGDDDFESNLTMDDPKIVPACTEDIMLPLGKIEVIVMEVKVQDDSVFLAVRPTNLQNDFQQLQTDLNDFYSDAQDEPNCSLALGPCAIQSSDKWYRGNILAIEDECVTVLYSDLGHGESINASHIRKLQESFGLYPPYIIWCTLQGFRCTDAAAVSNHLNVNLKNAVLPIDVLDEEHLCQIKFSEDNTIISELLSKGLLVTESVRSEEPDVHATLLEKSILNCTSESISEFINSPLSNQNSFVNESLANENSLLDQNQNAQVFSLDDAVNQNISAQEKNG